jgi:2-keto-myo-inositol isomerase
MNATANIEKLSRRQALARAGALAGAALIGDSVPAAASPARSSGAKDEAPFIFSLNTATIRGQKLGLAREVELVARAGYQAIEPWIDTIETYVRAGGSLKDMRKRIRDLGLRVVDAIGFAEWIVDDPARRARGMEQAKRELDLVAQLGGERVAAPPAGATNRPGLDLAQAAERYRQLLEMGDQVGVVPQLELWGFSKNLFRIGQCACVAIETGHPKACILLDIFHIYKGGSNFHGLRLLNGSTVHILHMNDYPAQPLREQINDSYRRYPGDGIAPIPDLLRVLRGMGGPKILSLELFNRKYWAQDPLQVLKTGLAKMQAVAAQAAP